MVDVVDNIGGTSLPFPRLGQPWIAEGSYSATSTHLTPEPGTALLLLTAGVIALAGIRRRRR